MWQRLLTERAEDPHLKYIDYGELDYQDFELLNKVLNSEATDLDYSAHYQGVDDYLTEKRSKPGFNPAEDSRLNFRLMMTNLRVAKKGEIRKDLREKFERAA